MREFIIRTRNYLLILLLIYLGYLAIKSFAGTNDAPECANKQSINTVYQIFKEKVLPTEGFNQQEISNVKMTLSNIVTLDKNSNTGAYFCQANLAIDNGSNKLNVKVAYNNRIIEDDKNQFLTTITNYQL